MKYVATWNQTIIAEADENDVLRIEGNIYFPPTAVKKEFLKPSDTHTTCHWKGEASYFHVVADGMANLDSAWYYPNPAAGSPEIVAEQNNDKYAGNYANFIAFWRGVEVTA